MAITVEEVVAACVMAVGMLMTKGVVAETMGTLLAVTVWEMEMEHWWW